MTTGNTTGLEIAVIGMAGRFPGAKDIHEFWQNLKNGVESFTFFTEQELLEAGVEPDLLRDPNYVKSSGGVLENKEYFDAAFFGFKPTEAEIMDPQTRIFLQCTWHALEDAGYDPGSYKGLIGVYAGSSSNFRWEALTYASGRVQILGPFTSSLYSHRDYLCTHVSYNLGLKGPSLYAKTACSTSLVAVHLACQAILNGECDMALAGGVSISIWEKSGYLYQEGMIISPDGHNRAFDARGKGTVGGEGAGTVVLKRLEEAIEDNDHIYAVIKGTAVDNDGSRKIGFTAPSIDGQADVIREALHVANVEPGTITYVETHGTATPVGDPIEIEALKKAFKTDEKGFCAIGSVKTNIGHLDAAAGIAGFIKTVLALVHREIPPSLHYETPNPNIDFENSPFHVNTTLTPWKTQDTPLRAGVSSFGIGGTNVHVILEEYNIASGGQEPFYKKVPGPPKIFYYLLLFSAKTSSALDKMTSNLVNCLKQNTPNPADTAYTLQVGRKHFPHRRITICSSTTEAVEILSSMNPRKVLTNFTKKEDRPVIFMFPGLGAQYAGMGRDLYETIPIFHEEMNRCFEILDKNRSNRSYRTYINADPESVQLQVFMIEYALAKLVMHWGVQPRAMMGYSFGEYTAACIAGVLSLEDALNLVVQRSRIIQEVTSGAMLSIPLPQQELLPLLKNFTALSVAIDNGPSCVIAGPTDQVETFDAMMKEKKTLCVPLPTSHAIHSKMMEPVLTKFRDAVARFKLKEPQIPYISNVTGKWITPPEAQDPGYWATHLRNTVRFADGIKELLNNPTLPHPAFLEIGPGYDLCTLIRHHTGPEGQSTYPAFNLLDQAQCRNMATHHDARYLLNRLGRLWLSGAAIDWAQFNREEKRRRVSLPGYPFEEQRYRIDGDPLKMSAAAAIQPGNAQPTKKTNIADWFYIPTWKRSVLPHNNTELNPGDWLIFIDGAGLGERFARRLEQQGREVIRVTQGPAFTATGAKEYIINPGQPHDYLDLFKHLNKIPCRTAHFWNVTGEGEEIEVDKIEELGFYSLIYLAQAAGKQGLKDPMQIMVISNNLQRVTSEEKLHPEKAALLGAVKVIPREYFNIKCRSVDIQLPGPGSRKEELPVEQILNEFHMDTPDEAVAYRGEYRWVQLFEPTRLHHDNKSPLAEGGVYLITGGLGGIGLALAEHLVKKTNTRTRLVLTGRSVFPAREEWDRWLTSHQEEDPAAQKMRKVQELEKSGAEVLFCSADVADPEQMRAAVNLALERFGTIDGVIHAAGLPDGGMIPLRTKESIAPVLHPKIKGTLVLDQVLKEKNIKPAFFILCSSLSAVTGLFGQAAYCAANAFLDAFAYRKTHEEGVFTTAIDWDSWKEVGMGVDTVRQLVETRNIEDSEALLRFGMLTAEGTEVFDRVLAANYPQVIVSTWDLFARLRAMDSAGVSGAGDSEEIEMANASRVLRPRPEITAEYQPPSTDFEKTFAGILQTFFGFEQVGIHDNLFEFGITSLDMIHINNTLKKKIARDIPIVVMFEYPTIHTLGRYLELDETAAESQPEDLNKVEDLLHNTIDAFRNFE
ncbi:MAG: SDR family NAD(P)-dependent oxidoreductase [Candidatus Aminicenantes bacterium]|nr:SDR family NAD(P)-dependent oxidoreductase [Candidatus Aminicenantes bacterium]